MGLFSRLFGQAPTTTADREREGARLDARRRHLRGRISRVQSDLRGSWTEYRTWRGDDKGKKAVKARIRHLEAERKHLVKEMMRLQSEMKKLGYKAAAGHVEMH